MTIKQKLQNSKKKSIISKFVILLAMLYLFMIVIKGLYFLTESESIGLSIKINEVMRWIIENTYFTPLNFIWDKIPSRIFDNEDVFLFYKILIPPMVILIIGGLFVQDYTALKNRYTGLENIIKEEKELSMMRKEANIYTVPNTDSIDVRIYNIMKDTPAWHNRWWGKIVIGLLTALVIILLGLK